MSRYLRIGLACAALIVLTGVLRNRTVPAAQGQAAQKWADFEITALLEQQKSSKRSYLSFLNVPTLTTGLYVLPKNGVDGQSPHKQDEVYYVVSGKGQIRVGSGDQAEEITVKPGSIVFVKAGVEHQFHDIAEELQLLVFFSTAESS